MTMKMKGLLKGLRYISQIFDADEEKEEEMQIGLPTDVKHVAHIGSDGPKVDTPSWMKEFKTTSECHTKPPLDLPRGDGPDIQLGSQGTSNCLGQDVPKKKDSTKSRSSRRHQHTAGDTNQASTSSPARSLPDIPKKSRKKKSKETDGGDGSTRSREGRVGTTRSRSKATKDDKESRVGL